MVASVRSASLGNFAEVARRHGLDPERMIRGAGLDPAFLASPDLRIPTASVVKLLEKSARDSRCATFGLEMAESWRMSDFGAISLLLTHQRTLRGALETTIRYSHLLNDTVALSIEEAGGLVIVREDLMVEAAARSRQAIELALGVVFRMFRALLGPQWRPRRIQFIHAAPPDLAVHRRIFGPNLAFRSDFNGIVCDAADLDRPNPASDSALEGYARRFVESLPAAGTPGAAQDVRRSIHQLLPRGRASIGHVARALGTNPRALQRRLEASGENFSALLNATRRELVLRHLDNPSYSLTQVAAMLGYGFPSSFTRWFSSEFGVSPARWRAQRSGESVATR
jgi:AraC-like DNA-binding protein